MIIDRNYDYYEDEKLYSTGDYELDDLLEKAFCDGYEYAQREFSSKGQHAMRKAFETAAAKKNVKVPEFISSEFKTIKNPEYEKALNKEINYVRWQARQNSPELGTINRSINDKAVYRGGIGYNLTPSKKNARWLARRGDKSLQMSRDHGVFARDLNNIVDSNKSVADTIKVNRKWNPNERVVEIVKKRKN